MPCVAGWDEMLDEEEEERIAAARAAEYAKKLAQWQAGWDRTLGRCCIGWYPTLPRRQYQYIHEMTYTRMVRVGSRRVAKPRYASAFFVPLQGWSPGAAWYDFAESGFVWQNGSPYTGRDAFRMDQQMAIEKAAEISGKASTSNRGWRAVPLG